MRCAQTNIVVKPVYYRIQFIIGFLLANFFSLVAFSGDSIVASCEQSNSTSSGHSTGRKFLTGLYYRTIVVLLQTGIVHEEAELIDFFAIFSAMYQPDP